MRRQNEHLLSALKASIHGKKINWSEDISTADWLSLFRLAESQKVLPMVYDAVYDCPAADLVLMQRYKAVIRQQIMVQVMKTAEFQRLYQKLTAAGLRPLVVKGITCRNIYPNPDARISGDEDILIPWNQFDTAHEAMLDYGMELLEPEQDIKAAYEVSYGKKGSPIHIELHKSLFSLKEEAYEGLNSYFEGIHERGQSITIQGTEFWVPDDTEHLFFLICHTFKHFLHSGFGIRQVSDICLFAQVYGEQVDWNTIRKNCREIHAEMFTAAVFQIGRTYLDIPTPSDWPEVDEIPLLEDILSGGVYGAVDLSRLHSSTITLNAVTAARNGKQAPVWKSAFPAAEKLTKRYPYLAKYPILLPIAWGNRLLQYRRETKNTDGNDISESIKIGRQRITLLRKYGIIEE